ncbi:MAG: hypothetical protein JNJ54_23930 [Myxococcaceae bacterium]|nr:hypothetical protein [Myxococcaceae bacterium]
MREAQRAQLEDFLARLPEGSRGLRLTRFRRATLGSHLGDLASELLPGGGDSSTAPGDSRPHGVTLTAHDAAGSTLADLELHPLPSASDDDLLHACVVRAHARELTIDVFAGPRHLERLGSTTLDPPPLDEGAAHASSPDADVFTFDLCPRPPRWMRGVVALFTAALLPVLLAAVLFREGRALWRTLLLPMLWPRRSRWRLRLSRDAVAWNEEPGWAPPCSGQVPRAELLAVSVAPDAWTVEGALAPSLRLVTTTATLRIPTPLSAPLTRLAAVRLVALRADAPGNR